jgi:HNH endonuclease
MATPKGTIPWNKGKGKGWTDKRGYRWVYVSENGRKRAKREHRHIMEQHLGRRLDPEDVVHHRNGNKSDNRLENLEVKPFGLHTAEHHAGTKQAEQTKITLSVMTSYREDNKRLKQLNADLLEALEYEVRNCPLCHGTTRARTAMFVLNDAPAPPVTRSPDSGQGWQPIETAVKDGFHVQLYRPDIQFVGYWSDAGWCMQGCKVIDPAPTYWKPLGPPPALAALQPGEADK